MKLAELESKEIALEKIKFNLTEKLGPHALIQPERTWVIPTGTILKNEISLIQANNCAIAEVSETETV